MILIFLNLYTDGEQLDAASTVALQKISDFFDSRNIFDIILTKITRRSCEQLVHSQCLSGADFLQNKRLSAIKCWSVAFATCRPKRWTC